MMTHQNTPHKNSPHTPLKIAIVQANPTVGDLAGNTAQIIAARNAHKGCDLVVLSECFLTGYPLKDLTSRPHFIADVARQISHLAEHVKQHEGPAILFGAPTKVADSEATPLNPYNSAILIRPDGSISMTHKQQLPNNDVFDEVRNFTQYTGAATPMMLNGWALGVMICEDGWHAQTALQLAANGADMLISLNGSPSRIGKLAQREMHMQARVAETGLPLIYTNQFGGQDELVFDGSSFALDRHGKPCAMLPFMQGGSALFVVEKDMQPNAAATNIIPVSAYAAKASPSDEELMYRAGVLGLRDYVRKNNMERVFIGISGGADSAAVAAIAADALGAENVIGLRLPSSLTGHESMDLAEKLMTRLGCRLETVSIAGAAEATLLATAHLSPKNAASGGLAKENMQARLRMIMLMYAANAMGGMLLTTGNKSEASVGYATQYGDMAGQYNVLKDLYKTEVWDIMRWRNAHVPADSLNPVENPIPDAIITRPPTAELAEGQTDEASLGAYPVLDALLKGLVEGQLDIESARNRAEKQLDVVIPQDYAHRVRDLLYKAEFKRVGAAIGPQIRPNSFGLGRRYPITNHYREGL